MRGTSKPRAAQALAPFELSEVSADLGERCKLICKLLKQVGLEVYEPKGGYFVWVKSKGKMTGKGGE